MFTILYTDHITNNYRSHEERKYRIQMRKQYFSRHSESNNTAKSVNGRNRGRLEKGGLYREILDRRDAGINIWTWRNAVEQQIWTWRNAVEQQIWTWRNAVEQQIWTWRNAVEQQIWTWRNAVEQQIWTWRNAVEQQIWTWRNAVEQQIWTWGNAVEQQRTDVYDDKNHRSVMRLHTIIPLLERNRNADLYTRTWLVGVGLREYWKGYHCYILSMVTHFPCMERWIHGTPAK